MGCTSSKSHAPTGTPLPQAVVRAVPASEMPQTFVASDGTKFDSRAAWRKHEFATRYTFKGQRGTAEHRLQLMRRPGEIDGQPFNLEDLEHCNVRLLDVVEQVQCDALKRCTVVLGACRASVFVRECEDCTFHVASAQLRTRDCKRCTFYLLAGSAPAIELSSDMLFAPHSVNYPHMAEHLQAAGLSLSANQWRAVFDFNAPNGGEQGEHAAGAHWGVVPDSERASGKLDISLADIEAEAATAVATQTHASTGTSTTSVTAAPAQVHALPPTTPSPTCQQEHRQEEKPAQGQG